MAPIPAPYALAGVTTVREMWGRPVHHEWREKIRSSALLGPPLGGRQPHRRRLALSVGGRRGSDHRGARRGRARCTVRQVKREGADFVKVYSRLSRETYFAIADGTVSGHPPSRGHCPDTVPIAEASAAGQRTIEHLHALLLATSRHEKEIRRLLAAVRIDPREVHPSNGGRCRATTGTGRTPSRAEEWKYLPAWQVESWPDQLAALNGGRTPEQRRQIRRIFAHRLHLVRELHGAGVRLAAGTDTGTGYLVPGFALHDELALLVAAGLTPAEVLRVATRDAARTLGLPAVGTVARGQAADLLVLDADPLRDIRNTRRIHGVVVNGRWLPTGGSPPTARGVEEAAAQAQPPQEGSTMRGCGCGGHP
ncbi:amidohydrolase family protein [Streptomyces sp. NPDC005760]|uniref:amidohydrolase family protein n=1 Tax=Streptomyces sp. NPDC005760 TaxID=3156718 RepID=UPI0033DCFCD1